MSNARSASRTSLAVFTSSSSMASPGAMSPCSTNHDRSEEGLSNSSVRFSMLRVLTNASTRPSSPGAGARSSDSMIHHIILSTPTLCLDRCDSHHYTVFDGGVEAATDAGAWRRGGARDRLDRRLWDFVLALADLLARWSRSTHRVGCGDPFVLAYALRVYRYGPGRSRRKRHRGLRRTRTRSTRSRHRPRVVPIRRGARHPRWCAGCRHLPPRRGGRWDVGATSWCAGGPRRGNRHESYRSRGRSTPTARCDLGSARRHGRLVCAHLSRRAWRLRRCRAGLRYARADPLGRRGRLLGLRRLREPHLHSRGVQKPSPRLPSGDDLRFPGLRQLGGRSYHDHRCDRTARAGERGERAIPDCRTSGAFMDGRGGDHCLRPRTRAAQLRQLAVGHVAPYLLLWAGGTDAAVVRPARQP